jgi:hypothetical protein
LVIKAVDIISPGNETIIINEKLHPLVNAKTKPEIVIAIAKIMIPIFSPKAF